MSIRLTYSCSCGWHSLILDDAQSHANETEHHVTVQGYISPQEKVGPKAVSADERIQLKARESEIMRRAKELGLVVQKR